MLELERSCRVAYPASTFSGAVVPNKLDSEGFFELLHVHFGMTKPKKHKSICQCHLSEEMVDISEIITEKLKQYCLFIHLFYR